MNALRLPKERVNALSPVLLESHLLAHGWQERAGASTAQVRVFEHPSHPAEELVVPRDKGFVDFALRVGEVLVTLAALERTTAWELLEELTPTSAPDLKNGASPSSAVQVGRDAS